MSTPLPCRTAARPGGQRWRSGTPWRATWRSSWSRSAPSPAPGKPSSTRAAIRSQRRAACWAPSWVRDRSTPDLVQRFLEGAARHGLDVDLHVDETLAPAIRNVVTVADAVMTVGYRGRVLAGHCCSLSTSDGAALEDAVDRIAAAGMSVVCLPTTNGYLQDRDAGRTPRRRGLPPVHELRARGVPVAFASDNVGDAFYPFGDYDMLDLFRHAVTAAHLDGDLPGWIDAAFGVPARAIGAAGAGRLRPGARADLVVFRARTWFDLLGGTHADRIVVNAGRVTRRDGEALAGRAAPAAVSA